MLEYWYVCGYTNPLRRVVETFSFTSTAVLLGRLGLGSLLVGRNLGLPGGDGRADLSCRSGLGTGG